MIQFWIVIKERPLRVSLIYFKNKRINYKIKIEYFGDIRQILNTSVKLIKITDGHRYERN